MRTDVYFDSCGAGKIHVCRWEPVQKPRAVMQIVHGIADYAERYDDFANFLTQNGILVVAEDHMGHGRSDGASCVRGYFNGGWFNAVQDTYQLLETTRNEFPDIPFVLFGHSMGSFIAQTILQKHPDSGISACILCGSGWQSEVALSAGLRICNAACRIYGEKKPSPRLQALVFGAYNMRVERPRTPYDWINRNNRAVDTFIADPLRCDAVTAGLMRDMLIGISFIQQDENMSRMSKTLPILLISGGDDPVGSYGEGVRKIAEKFEATGMESVLCRIYPLCRHEILNEINKVDIYQDILGWLENLVLRTVES